MFAVNDKLDRYDVKIDGPIGQEHRTMLHRHKTPNGRYVLAEDVHKAADQIFKALEIGDIRLARGLVRGLKE